MFEIAKIYTEGCGELEPDPQKASEYRKKAEKEDEENLDFDDDILEDAEDVENPEEE